MKSPKLLRLKKEAEPERLRLEAQIRKTKELLEQLRRDLDRHLAPVRNQADKEAKYWSSFKNGQTFALRDVSECGDTRYCESMHISPWEADSSILYLMRGSKKLYVLYGLPKDTPAPIAEETATRVLEADGYRFIPCTWLDDHHVQIHWPEDLK